MIEVTTCRHEQVHADQAIKAVQKQGGEPRLVAAAAAPARAVEVWSDDVNHGGELRKTSQGSGFQKLSQAFSGGDGGSAAGGGAAAPSAVADRGPAGSDVAKRAFQPEVVGEDEEEGKSAACALISLDLPFASTPRWLFRPFF